VDHSKFRTCSQTGFCDRQRSGYRGAAGGGVPGNEEGREGRTSYEVVDVDSVLHTTTSSSSSDATTTTTTTTSVKFPLLKSPTSNGMHSARSLTCAITYPLGGGGVGGVWRVQITDDDDDEEEEGKGRRRRWVYEGGDTTPLLPGVGEEVGELTVEPYYHSTTHDPSAAALPDGFEIRASGGGADVIRVLARPFKIQLVDTTTTTATDTDTDTDDGTVVMEVNGGGGLHFDERGVGGGGGGGGGGGAGTANSNVPDDSEDRHAGKKVVGYWEDGLAIYSDGSREEKKKLSSSSSSSSAASDDSGPPPILPDRLGSRDVLRSPRLQAKRRLIHRRRRNLPPLPLPNRSPLPRLPRLPPYYVRSRTPLR